MLIFGSKFAILEARIRKAIDALILCRLLGRRLETLDFGEYGQALTDNNNFLPSFVLTTDFLWSCRNISSIDKKERQAVPEHGQAQKNGASLVKTLHDEIPLDIVILASLRFDCAGKALDMIGWTDQQADQYSQNKFQLRIGMNWGAVRLRT